MCSRCARNSGICYTEGISVVLHSVNKAVGREIHQTVPSELGEREEIEVKKIESLVDERAEDKQCGKDNIRACKMGPPEIFPIVLVILELFNPWITT